MNNANSVDPDQMPHSAASDLGLHYLPMSLLWEARLKWVKRQSAGKVKSIFLGKIRNIFQIVICRNLYIACNKALNFKSNVCF